MSVHKKLMQVRVDLAHLSPQRSGFNKFQGYKYFELSDFIPQTMELFLKHGLCGYISYSNDEATLSITDVEDGTVIVIRSPMATAELKGNHDIQNLGAVQSYQRRYCWIAALELCETDSVEIDKQLKQSEPEVKAAPKPAPKPEYQPTPPPPPEPIKRRVDPIPPQYVETRPTWTMTIDASDDVSWVDMMVEMNILKISLATNSDDLKQIFQVNKAFYERLKTLNPSVYADVIDNFATAKKSFME